MGAGKSTDESENVVFDPIEDFIYHQPSDISGAWSLRLVNDNLMPFLKNESIEEELAMGIEKRLSVVQASAQMNPWIEVARAWSSQVGPERMKRGIVTINDANNEIISRMEMILPMDIPSVPRICVYWDAATEMTVDITAIDPRSSDAEKDIRKAQNDTWAILNAAFGSRFPVERKDFVAVFRSILETLQQGNDSISSANQILELGLDIGLIRYKMESDQPYIFEAG